MPRKPTKIKKLALINQKNDGRKVTTSNINLFLYIIKLYFTTNFIARCLIIVNSLIKKILYNNFLFLAFFCLISCG